DRVHVAEQRTLTQQRRDGLCYERRSICGDERKHQRSTLKRFGDAVAGGDAKVGHDGATLGKHTEGPSLTSPVSCSPECRSGFSEPNKGDGSVHADTLPSPQGMGQSEAAFGYKLGVT